MARDLLLTVQKALKGRYIIEAEIGRGGAARVFKGTDKSGRVVAVKVLRPELAVSVTAERFLREIALIERLHHPHIGGLLDSGQSDWLVYYAMPFIPGPSLQQILTQRNRISPPDTQRLAVELLSALAHAHERGIAHRDMKPENVMIGPEGAVLVDFGIARAIEAAGTDRLTKSGMAVGTSRYMSPEQIMGEAIIDPRTDLYSLACVLFECLAGRPPYVHPNEFGVLELHRMAPIPDVGTFVPDLPEGLRQAITKALGKAPTDRWDTAAAMRAAITG